MGSTRDYKKRQENNQSRFARCPAFQFSRISLGAFGVDSRAFMLTIDGAETCILIRSPI